MTSRSALPRDWSGCPGADVALGRFDIGFGRSRLRLKLLVFETNADMCRFYDYVKPSGRGLGRRCLGCVFELSAIDGVEDPVYYAVMLLVRKHATTEIVCHESVHAAIAYAARVGGCAKWPGEGDEESICYPAGKIAERVRIALDQLRLVKKPPALSYSLNRAV